MDIIVEFFIYWEFYCDIYCVYFVFSFEYLEGIGFIVELFNFSTYLEVRVLNKFIVYVFVFFKYRVVRYRKSKDILGVLLLFCYFV